MAPNSKRTYTTAYTHEILTSDGRVYGPYTYAQAMAQLKRISTELRPNNSPLFTGHSYTIVPLSGAVLRP